jgi:RimJ/RimL family protein N-acetyltransferase
MSTGDAVAARLAFRSVGPTDRAGIIELFHTLTPESRRRRYLGPKHELTPRELSYFTDIDHVSHEAIAAVDLRDGSIVGVGRYVYVRNRAGVAELAIEVADALQNMGIGTALARAAMLRARKNGFTVLTATTLWDNRAARALLKRLGFRATASHGSELEHELALPAACYPLSASAARVSFVATSARDLTPSLR